MRSLLPFTAAAAALLLLSADTHFQHAPWPVRLVCAVLLCAAVLGAAASIARRKRGGQEQEDE